jgi:hypothetical protein
MSEVVQAAPGGSFSMSLLQVPISPEPVLELTVGLLALNAAVTIAVAVRLPTGDAYADAWIAAWSDALRSVASLASASAVAFALALWTAPNLGDWGAAAATSCAALLTVFVGATVRSWKDERLLRAERAVRVRDEIQRVQTTIRALHATRRLVALASGSPGDGVRWAAGQLVALAAPCWAVLAGALVIVRCTGRDLTWEILILMLVLTLAVVSATAYAGTRMLLGRRGAGKEETLVAIGIALVIAWILLSVGLGLAIAAQRNPSAMSLLVWVVSLATIPPALLVHAGRGSRWKGPGKLIAVWALVRLSARRRALRRELAGLGLVGAGVSRSDR